MDIFQKTYCAIGILFLIIFISIGVLGYVINEEGIQFCKDNGYDGADGNYVHYCYKQINDTIILKEYVRFGDSLFNQTRLFVE